MPSRPWQKVGTDLFLFHQCQYLITVDYYSSFFKVDKLNTTDSITVIEKLKTQFSRHGIPEIVISDNGLQYASAEFLNLQVTGTFNTSLPLHRAPKVTGRLKVW